MACIKSVAISLPRYSYTKDDIGQAGQKWLAHQPEQLALFQRFLASSRIERRRFALPLAEILSLEGLESRAPVFDREAPELARQAVQSCLAQSSYHTQDISTLIFASCSLPSIPCVDVLLINSLDFRRDVCRIPMFQHGCGAGAIGLSLASRLAEGGKPALLVCVELCSLIYQSDDLSGGNLVGSALFGDGGACALVAPGDDGPTFVDAQSFLLPNATHLMGYELKDNGFHLRLDKELPSYVLEHAPRLITEFLGRNGLSTSDIAWWLFHPGGAKIIQFLEQSFHIQAEQSRWAWDILAEYGNMSSASILFVLHKFLQDRVLRHGDRIFMLGMGPGLTLELILLECRG